MQNLINITYPWAVEVPKILIELEASHEGLSDIDAMNRLNIYGKNTFHKHERKSILSIFLMQFTSPLIFILIGAAIVTAILHEWVEVVVIIFAVLVNTGLGFYREYHAENTLEKLSTFIKDRTRIIRQGYEREVDSEEIVPGDIIKLSYGSRIPADARIISLNNLRVDESILTGESIPVQKSLDIVSISATTPERLCMVNAGTLVVDGFATAIVIATGDQTQIGKIAGLVSDTHRAKTPIQKGLSKLAWIIFAVVVVIVICIFILGIYRGESILGMLILSAAVSVGAVPEALPIALTVILSIGAERIAKKRGIIRTLIAAETLGSTTLIMTDKTGTLTEANMKLVGIYNFNDLINGNTIAKPYSENDRNLLDISISNINVLIENPNEDVSKWTFKGKPFEVNIAQTARENNIDISYLNSKNVSQITIPFNSTHKFSAAVLGNVSTVMGAPDVLLARSNVSADVYQAIEKWITTVSAQGKRLIAVGTTTSILNSPDDVQDINFVGILAFHDPVRKEVPDAIKKIESLGTRIVMVTGDIKGTAISVANELGWVVSEAQILSGHDLQAMSDEELLKILPDIKIFARMTPEDKLRIGLLYRKLGEIVAMTGDGVNDAPSLKAMDIGVALGSSSDVAKGAADLVLLDDNFLTISTAIQEGRRILVNIRKTFVYLMSNSLDEVCVIGGSLLVGIALPISALQIIWVNLFTGSLPALAFAFDEDFDHDVTKKHTLRSIFTKEVNILTFGIGIVSSLLLFFMYYFLIRQGVQLEIARSVFFVCFASYILIISFSFRSLHKPLFSYPTFSNHKLNQSILIAGVLLVATIVVPALRELFGLALFPAVWLWFILGWLVLNMFLVEGAKYLFRINKR